MGLFRLLSTVAYIVRGPTRFWPAGLLFVIDDAVGMMYLTKHCLIALNCNYLYMIINLVICLTDFLGKIPYGNH